MAVHQTSSVLDEMSFALSNKDEMVDNVMTVLPIELTNATGTYLQDLNEDCLLEIFSRNPLTPMDFCSLAETCKRFKQITQRMFPKGFAIDRSYSGCMYTFYSEGQRELECTFQDTERILKHFAPHLSELRIKEDLNLVNLVAKYCDDITLKRLGIACLESVEGVTQQLNSIFQRLLQLSVWKCNLPIEPWGMNCESLIELAICDCENSAAFLKNNFPILEQLFFESKHDECNHEALSEFVRRHGYLKSITIFCEPFNTCKLLQAISFSCNELVELTFVDLLYAFVDISHLQSLPKLEVLRIGFATTETMEDKACCEEIDFSGAFTALKTMEISFCGGTYVVPNQIFDVLSRLQGLRKLKLVNCDLNRIPWKGLSQLRKVHLIGKSVKNSDNSTLLDVIRQLIKLEKLKYVKLKNPLTKEEFRNIVKIVERRAHVLSVKCFYDFNYEENCNENCKVKLIKSRY